MSDPILNDAARVIEAFGGIRPMAKKLGVAVTTIQGWKERNAIPVQRLEQIREAAKREGIDLLALQQAATAPQAAASKSTEAQATEPKPTATGNADAKSAASASSRPTAAASAASAAGKPAQKVQAEKVSPTASGVKESEASKTGPTVNQTAPKPAGRGRAFAFGAGFAVILIIGAVAGWFLRDAFMGSGADGQQTAALEKRLAASEKAAADAAAQAKAAGDRAGTLAAQLKSVTAQVAKLEKAAPAGDGKAVASLQNDLKALRADLDALGKTLKAGADGKLADEVAKLQAAVAALQKAGPSGQGTGGDGSAQAAPSAQTQAALKKLSDSVAALSAKVEALPGDAAAKQAAQSIANLGKQIAAMEGRLKTVEAGAGGQVGAVVALSQLRTMAGSGRAYDAALSVAQKLAGGNAAVAAVLKDLAPAAKSGAPTLPVLRGEFDGLSSGLVAAATRAQGDGWVDRAWNKLKSTVVVRRTGREVKGSSPSALVAQAEVKLADGDLAAALALVRKLPAPARKAAAGWLAKADRRAAIDGALARLDALLPTLSGAAGKSQ